MESIWMMPTPATLRQFIVWFPIVSLLTAIMIGALEIYDLRGKAMVPAIAMFIVLVYLSSKASAKILERWLKKVYGVGRREDILASMGMSLPLENKNKRD